MSILIHDNIAFHNAAALESRAGLPGLAMVRVPAGVRKHLNPGARFTGAESTGVEMRFVCDSAPLRVAVSAQEKAVSVEVYRGGFECASHSIAAGAVKMIDLGQPDPMRNFDLSQTDTGPFSPNLWRLVFSGGCAAYLGIEAPGYTIRPPRSDELPSVRWLAYGSSITQSWSRGYPHMAARALKVDVLNKGLSGSCHFEPELADHFATNETWDLATLELGVNVRGLFSPETFRERATYFLNRLRESRPEAPIALITHYVNRDHLPHKTEGQTNAGKAQDAYDDILRDLASRGDPNTHLFEGREILADFEGLSGDLLHPSQYGHIHMGWNLAQKLRPIVLSIPTSG
jgi:lysophospholipase L1-like esterase